MSLLSVESATDGRSLRLSLLLWQPVVLETAACRAELPPAPVGRATQIVVEIRQCRGPVPQGIAQQAVHDCGA